MRVAVRVLRRDQLRRERILFAALVVIGLFVMNEARELLDAPTDVYPDTLIFNWTER